MSETYEAVLEQSRAGWHLAQLLDLPGCFATGATPAEALERLREVLPRYYAWLREKDDYTPVVAGPFAVTLAESQSASGAEVFYPHDAEPVTTEDLDWYLALMDWAAADLATHAAQVPPQALAQALAVVHGAVALLDGGAASAPPPPAGSAAEQVAATVRAASARLRAAREDERARLWQDGQGRRWSLRKVLRLCVLALRGAPVGG